ncbi:MAG: ABC transporter ATP-binding protein [bacterium]
MSNYSLSFDKVTKIYGRRLVFKEVTAEFNSGSIYGIAGRNGSGKSTLSKIIAGLISPSSGSITHTNNGKKIIPEKLHDHIGFVSPYLVLYDEFSSEENLKHFAKIRGIKFDKERIDFLLNEFGIYERRKDLLKEYSSGMKQRMKFVFALQHSPQLLILDEPTSNLDVSGKEKVFEFILKEAVENCIVIASNEEVDLALCEHIIKIEDYKTKSDLKLI